MHRPIHAVIVLVLAALLSGSASAGAGTPKHLFKIASLAPAGSVWARHFETFAEKITTDSGGEIGFKIYPGGVMGDDRAVLRKIRVGQIHGGGFTMIGISETVPDFRVLSIPFLFRSYAEIDFVADQLRPRMEAEFIEQDLVLLAMSEVGFTYPMSTAPLTSLSDFQKARCWLPEGDPVSSAFLGNIGVSAIPLAIPEVLAALNGGMVNAVFNSYYGGIVLQWYTATPYLTDIPFSYSYGAFAVTAGKFARLSPHQQQLVRQTARQTFAAMLADTRRSNDESLQLLRKNGVTIVSASSETISSLNQGREKSVSELAGRNFSQKIYEDTITFLKAYRAKEKEPSSTPLP